MTEMVAWASGLMPAGEEITVEALKVALTQHTEAELGRGYVLSETAVYGCEAFLDEVFGEGEAGEMVEGVGTVWATEALVPVRDLQIVWQRSEAPALPQRRQRTRRR